MSYLMTRVWLIIIAVLVAALGVERVRGDRARASAIASALVRDSVEAARDRTREVTVAALRDSVRVFVRRAQQQEQRADALDRAIKVRRVARLDAAVHVAVLDTVFRVDTVLVSADSERRAAFTVRQAPYTVSGEVRVTPSNADSVLLKIELDSIPLQVRLACEATPGAPVNRASVVVVAPPWALISLGEVSQSPAVCNPALARGRGGGLAGMMRRVGVSAGAGILIVLMVGLHLQHTHIQ